MSSPVDIRSDHLEIMQGILREHLPMGVKVWVFGSRANWTTKDSSDLDIALEGENKLSHKLLGALKDTFEDSTLPYTVDVVDLHAVSHDFKKIVEEQRVALPSVRASERVGGAWREVALGDLIDIKHGYAFKGAFIHDESVGDVLLTPGNFAIGGGFQAGKTKHYNGTVPSEFVLSENDLLLTMTDLSKKADTLGYPALIPASPNRLRFLHNQRLGKVVLRDPESTHKRYIYYVLCSKEYRDEVLASATGTTVKHTSPERIKRYRFPLPPLPEQRAIAHILGTLDDKIELNWRINETLEAMARALFKSWFVDFEPVRAKMEGRWRLGESLPGLPAEHYDLFPDRLVDSELGEIPEGWEVKGLGEVALQRRSGVKPEEIDEASPYIALEHMPKRCIALRQWSNADGLASGKFKFEQGDILFGKLRPYFHKVGVAPLDGVCSTDIVVVQPKSNLWFGFVLGHTSSAEFVDYTDATSTGTRMPRTNWADMARYKVALPSIAVSKAFTRLVEPYVNRIVSAIHESHSLAAQRDALLPRLVSGKVEVEDANEPLHAVKE